MCLTKWCALFHQGSATTRSEAAAGARTSSESGTTLLLAKKTLVIGFGGFGPPIAKGGGCSILDLGTLEFSKKGNEPNAFLDIFDIFGSPIRGPKVQNHKISEPLAKGGGFC